MQNDLNEKIKIHLKDEIREIEKANLTKTSDITQFKDELLKLFRPDIISMFSFNVCFLKPTQFDLFMKETNASDYKLFETVPSLAHSGTDLKLEVKEKEAFELLKAAKNELDQKNNYDGMYARWRDDDLCAYGSQYEALGGDEKYEELKKKLKIL